MFTEAHKAQIENQLQARNEDDLKKEHLFILQNDTWYESGVIYLSTVQWCKGRTHGYTRTLNLVTTQ